MEVPTWVRCSVNEHVNSKAKLYDDNYIQDTRDPFVFPRYRVSSVTVMMSERAQIDEEH